MKKKRRSLKELQTTQLTDQQQLNTKGGYLIRPTKFSTSKVYIIEDDIDIREPLDSENAESAFNDKKGL